MLEVEPFCMPNRVKDPNNKNLLEQKHSPVIEAPSEVKAGEFFNVVIRVGEIEHLNQDDHFIHWIKIYLDDLYLTRTDFTPVMTTEMSRLLFNQLAEQEGVHEKKLRAALELLECEKKELS